MPALYQCHCPILARAILAYIILSELTFYLPVNFSLCYIKHELLFFSSNIFVEGHQFGTGSGTLHFCMFPHRFRVDKGTRYCNMTLRLLFNIYSPYFHGALNSLHITLMLILCSIIINVLLYVCTVCVIMLNK